MLAERFVRHDVHEHLGVAASLAVIERIRPRRRASGVRRVQRHQRRRRSLLHDARGEHEARDAGRRAQAERGASVGFELALDTDAPYRAFQQRVSKQRDELTALIRKLAQEGEARSTSTAHRRRGTPSSSSAASTTRSSSARPTGTPTSTAPRLSAPTSQSSARKIARAKVRCSSSCRGTFLTPGFVKRRAGDAFAAGCAIISPLPKVEIVRGA